MATHDNIYDAAKEGCLEDVKYFIEQKGVDVNAKDDFMGYPPLQWAFLSNNAETIKYLMLKGADIEPHWIFDVVTLEKDGLEIVKLFIEKGVSVNHRDSGMFPLLVAAASNNMEVVKYLVSNGADINMVSSATGLTALQRAEEIGNTEIVNFLKEAEKKLEKQQEQFKRIGPMFTFGPLIIGLLFYMIAVFIAGDGEEIAEYLVLFVLLGVPLVIIHLRSDGFGFFSIASIIVFWILIIAVTYVFIDQGFNKTLVYLGSLFIVAAFTMACAYPKEKYCY